MRNYYLLILLPLFLSAAETDCCRDNSYSFPCSNVIENYSTLPSCRHCIQQECKPEFGAGIVTLDFLFWQAKEEGLEYALTDNLFPNPALQLNIDAEVIHPDFSWEPAFKLGIGYALKHGGWDFYLNWTYFHAHSSNSVSKGFSQTENGLIPLWQFPKNAVAVPSIRYTRASASWELHFNTMDFELGRESRLSNYLCLRIHGGLKGAIVNQNFDVFYENGQTAPINIISGDVQIKNNSKALGPRLGFNSRWDLTAGWNLVANGAMSLILFQFKDRTVEIDTADNAGAPIINDIHFSEKIWIFKPVSEIALGVNWGTCFGCRGNRYFGFFLGYELQYWWEQNLTRRFVDQYNDGQTYPNRGDLFLHGLTVNLRLEF